MQPWRFPSIVSLQRYQSIKSKNNFLSVSTKSIRSPSLPVERLLIISMTYWPIYNFYVWIMYLIAIIIKLHCPLWDHSPCPMTLTPTILQYFWPRPVWRIWRTGQVVRATPVRYHVSVTMNTTGQSCLHCHLHHTRGPTHGPTQGHTCHHRRCNHFSRVFTRIQKITNQDLDQDTP